MTPAMVGAWTQTTPSGLQHANLFAWHGTALEIVLILVLIFQQQSTTTADNYHQLPVAIPVSSNNGSEDSYSSRPGSTEAAGMGPGLPVSSSARITADHMNGNFSRGNAAGISGRIFYILQYLQTANTSGKFPCLFLVQENIHNSFLLKHGCNKMFYMYAFFVGGVGDGNTVCIMVYFINCVW